jgi:hypothetical protein
LSAKNSESRAKFYACSGAAVSCKNQGSFLQGAIVNPLLDQVTFEMVDYMCKYGLNPIED